MENIIYYALIATQVLAMAILLGEMIYISLLRPSRFQVEILLLIGSTLIMLIGYTVEIFSYSISGGLLGAAISYIGKPFALVTTLAFVAHYCGYPINKKITAALSIFASVFPVILFTNGYDDSFGHHLYYATVDFDIDELFSPLILTRGPLYFLYMAFMIGIMSTVLVFIVRQFIMEKNKVDRHQLIYLGAMIVATMIGYAIYLIGLTGGYDTTMTGASIGAILMSILFFRYRLLDMLTLAKEKALEDASTGLLVLNQKSKTVYSNSFVNSLIPSCFTRDEILGLKNGKTIIEKENKVFEILKADVESKGQYFGKTIEITEITDKYNYSKRLEMEVEKRTKEIYSIQKAMISSIAGVVEARDNSTGQHIQRMSRYAEIIATAMYRSGEYAGRLSPRIIERLVEVAPLHDLGKIAVPDTILLKPGRLTPEEFDQIKLHTTEGEKIIRQCFGGVERPEYVEMAARVALSHHEKWNGTGYPQGLSGPSIPLEARIIALADVYDAIRSERCYKPAMTKEEAAQVIQEGSGTHFDPKIVEAFFSVIQEIEAI